MKAGLVVTLFSGIFGISGVALMAFGCWQLREAYVSGSWPAVEGRIVHSEMTQRESYSGPTEPSRITYWAEIGYEYEAEGRAWKGDRVSFGDAGTSNRPRVQGVVTRYPVGRQVKVFYQPGNAGSACLETGVSLVTWIMPGVGALFVMLGTGVYFLARRVRPKA